MHHKIEAFLEEGKKAATKTRETEKLQDLLNMAENLRDVEMGA
jgi:hypothetical protein